MKVVVGRIRHRVGGDDGEVVKGMKKRTRVVACCDDGDGRRMREGKEGSADGEGEGGEGNTVVAPGFYRPFQAPREACMDLKGERRVGEGVGRKREGECGEDSDEACGDSIPLQILHELHSENIKLYMYNQ